MPNWTTNELSIEGDEQQLRELFDLLELKDGQVDNFSILRKLYPCPKELSDTPSMFFANKDESTKSAEQLEVEAQFERNLEKYGHKDWYDWCCANWGTKWADADTYLKDTYLATGSMNSISFGFNTAWSPPISAFHKISQNFPKLKFILTYYEQGCGFAGCAGFLNGLVLDEFSENISVPEETDEDEDYWAIVDDAYMDLCSELENNVREILDEKEHTPLQETTN